MACCCSTCTCIFMLLQVESQLGVGFCDTLNSG